MDIRYRLGQFWRMWRETPLSAEARTAVNAILSPEERALFFRLRPSDQWHSYRVMGTLRAAGHDNPELMVAALLHDVGKTRAPLTIWERSLIVLAAQWTPEKMASWGQGKAVGWKRPFVVKMQHPVWSAEMAMRAGSRPLAVRLMRRHQDKLAATAREPEDELLRLLQWADDQN